ncbi:hypothetical protein GCM10022200_05330 [Microbacterium awajiense]|uniref:Uncharacterized protein n=1 Tax=Microbacterium awajiense TaxID=415214 RepID=A0ABP7A6U8_9MICO
MTASSCSLAELLGHPEPKARPAWARIVGGILGVGVIGLVAALIAWGIVGAVVGIAGLLS